ncbi:MAG: Gfo/Idh/MocA family oxidoreductase [Chloroflexi bacterium]|nr:Gfo/Idh/MocA family oxidoreductase [Chloroflexota bacterium]
MTIKLAFAGTGWVSKVHARAAKLLPQVELYAVVNHRCESMQSFANEFDIPRTFTDLDDLLSDGGADALVVGTPNALHAPQTMAALRHGMHVLVEKPMALNASEANAMWAASVESGALLMLAHNWRFHEEVKWLRAQIQSGRLGDIVRTHGFSIHMDWGPSGWFTRKDLAGGGALADMGVHAIDTARFLLGDPLPKSVFARTGTHYIESDVDDTAELIITWQDETYSHLEAGWWQPYAGGAEAAAGVYGTLGYGSIFPTRLKLRHPDGEIEMVDAGYPFPRQADSVHAMYERQMAYFIGCIEQDIQPSPGGTEGWVNMRIIDAAYQSSQSGQVVEI